ncbi:MAG TPA: DUF4349 domain-containing protein [Fimbriimonadaceae bacterium]|nr:DUF4349 domain-containing protein [Fimbriimonadaceae bacterium]HRJ33563.1 DUF4349 domain-containing protein [Fimbriimonadaceae bacterium]
MNRRIWIWVVGMVWLTALAVAGCQKTESAASEGSRYPREDAAAAAASEGGATLVTQNVAPEQERALVRRGYIAVTVEDLNRAEAEVKKHIAAMRGFVVRDGTSNIMKASAQVEMTVRVPVKSFDLTMEKVAGLGTVRNRQTESEDVTATLVDQDARLKIMRTQEKTYLKFLENARNIEESLKVQDRLMALRADIESLDAQNKTLRQLAQLSTIEITLLSPVRSVSVADDSNWVRDTWTSATNALGGTLAWLMATAIRILVFAPIWVPVLLVIRWVRENRRRKRAAARP